MNQTRRKILDRTAATARLSREIKDAEARIADALVSATALMYSCAIASRDNDASPSHVHAVLTRSQNTITRLVDARAEVTRTHGALRAVFRETAGPMEPYPCTETTFTGAEAGDENIAA